MSQPGAPAGPAPRRWAVLASLGLAVATSCTGAGGSGGGEAGLSPGSGPVTTTTTTAAEAEEAPEDLAGRLAAIEVAIRDPATPDHQLESLGRAQQEAYRTMAGDHYLAASVVAGLPPEVVGIVEANLAASRHLSDLSQPAPAEIPDWTIVAPPPAEELLAAYRAAEAATGAPWEYLAAIHLVETRMSRIRGNSYAGAQGPMQFIPTTWDIYGQGGDINDTGDAIAAAGRLLAANGAPGRMDRALFAYNPSQDYVEAVTAYAEQMAADERAFGGYYHWQVYYRGTLLPVGYGA